MKRVIILSALAFSLMACTTTKAVPVERVPLNISTPDPVTLEGVTWHAVTKENVDQVLNENGGVVFAVSSNDFKILNENLLKIANALKLAWSTIDAYRQYYGTKEE